jgi:D-alanine-D-alanine ligase
MKIGFTYDLRNDYLAQGYDEEMAAEFDRAETIQAITSALEALGHHVDPIGNLSALMAHLVNGERWELVFNIAEGLYGFGREAQVPALLDAFRIPYTFSDPLVLSLALHKGMAKHVVRDNGIATADFKVVESAAAIAAVDLPYPLFAKPVAEGSSKGIIGALHIDDRIALQSTCCQLLAKFQQPVLVETYLPGREFTVGILGSGAQAEALAVMEVVLRPDAEPGVYSLHNKEHYKNLVDYRLENSLLGKRVAETALAAWDVLGCRDAGRIDIRLDTAGVPNFIEANPLAGLNPIRSDLAIMAKLSGKDYQTIIRCIIDSAVQRIVPAYTLALPTKTR